MSSGHTSPQKVDEHKPTVQHTSQNGGDEEVEVPSHRSHIPGNNLKRSNPFKFGSRFLEEGDNVYEFNAWDHVTPDQSFYDFAEQQYAMQRDHPVTDFDKNRFNSAPEKWWDKFYSNNTVNFFKNRKVGVSEHVSLACYHCVMCCVIPFRYIDPYLLVN